MAPVRPCANVAARNESGGVRVKGEPTKRLLLETVLVKRPRCPRCDGIALRKYRSIKEQGDGSALSWVVCANEKCKHRFRILHE